MRADNPEEKMLGILGNFGDQDCLEAVSSIIKGVSAFSEGDLSKDRRLQQLRILGNLRNLESEINIIMESVAKWFKIENDPFYRRGLKEGIEKGLEEGQEKKTL
ncbi:MAG TPA: hypothetical protein VHC96_20135 [Puia sp.]|nr:hypothetical protein [Puia sp.]